MQVKDKHERRLLTNAKIAFNRRVESLNRLCFYGVGRNAERHTADTSFAPTSLQLAVRRAELDAGVEYRPEATVGVGAMWDEATELTVAKMVANCVYVELHLLITLHRRGRLTELCKPGGPLYDDPIVGGPRRRSRSRRSDPIVVEARSHLPTGSGAQGYLLLDGGLQPCG